MAALFTPAVAGGLSAAVPVAITTVTGVAIPKVPTVRLPIHGRQDLPDHHHGETFGPDNNDEEEGVLATGVAAGSVNKEKEKNCKSAMTSLIVLFIVILITIIIFIALDSVYDVIKEWIVGHYAKKALSNPRSKNSKEDIERTLIANQESLTATIIFSIVCITLCIVFLPMLMFAYIIFNA